jgi:hypothetical protein
MRWLLEDSRFKELSNGYKDVNEFLRDTQSAFSLVNIRPEERKQIAELIKDLQPKASQRAIADMVGVSDMTVGRDLGKHETATNVADETDIIGGDNVETATNVAPPAIPADDYDPIEKVRKKQQKEMRLQEKRRAAEVAAEVEVIEEIDYSVLIGDVWILGNHRLMCGDIYNKEDRARLLDGAMPAALITDPPYGIDYSPDWRKWDGSKSGFNKISGDDELFYPVPFLDYPTVVLWGANHFSNNLPVGGWMCWDKRLDVGKDNMIGSPFELAWFKSAKTSKKAVMIRVLHGGVVNADSIFGNNEKRLHPTQKPIEVMKQAIIETTKKGDMILDPFCGVGTILLACEDLGNPSYSMEIEPDYVAITLKRWEEKTGIKAMKS